MGINEKVKLDSTASHKVHGGTANPAPDQWVPFEWEEPGLGQQVHGEIAVIRTHGTSGSLQAGFWRTGPTSPGAQKDGSHKVVYSSPLGDETACVIEGSATLTVKSTGKKFHIAPGSIVSSPKNLEVTWEINGPYFKKYWCIFNGTQATPIPPRDLLVTNSNDNPQIGRSTTSSNRRKARRSPANCSSFAKAARPAR
jgi:uncharacterized cupin superfamily protein